MSNTFLPTATIEMLRRRSELTMAIHRFFGEKGFLHVETPLVSHDTVVDRHIDPVPIAQSSLTGSALDEQTMWLQTSPEFAMKRLLAGGMDSIYQITKAFRQGEQGQRHNPEFTMLEWYRRGDGMEAGMELLAEFVSAMFGRPSVEKISYRDAFGKYAGVDPFAETVDALALRCRSEIKAARDFSDAQSRDFWLDLILNYLVEPKIGFELPCIIYDWPASQAALAIVREDEYPVAERFELYVDGVELANGYHELLDADELLRRNEAANRQRVSDGKTELPVESGLLEAMRSGLPGCAGAALGVDRLLMVLAGAKSITEVMAFGFEQS